MVQTESLSKEKYRVLAERNGWSLAYSEGYVEGEYHRRRGKPMGAYVAIGMDEYCLGFRAGYFERKAPDSIANGTGDRLEQLPTSLRTG